MRTPRSTSRRAIRQALANSPSPYSSPGRGRLAAEVERVGRLELHAEGHLERGDARFELVVGAARLEVLLVEPLQQVELLALRGPRQVAVGDVAG